MVVRRVRGDKMLKKHIGKANEYVFSIGCGGMFTFMISQKVKVLLPDISNKISSMIQTGNTVNIKINSCEIFLFVISFLMILIAPILSQWSRKVVNEIVALIITTFVFCVGCVIMTATGKIDLTFLIVSWAFFSYLCWFCLGILKAVYKWLLEDESEQKYDAAKLTLLWTITAFLLGKFL